MGLYKKIEDDIKISLKSGDSVKLSVLRMVMAAAKMLQIEKNIKDPEDPDMLQIIQRHIKQHKESIEQFIKGNRPDLAEKEKTELKILESYMPKQLSESELEGIVKEVAESSGISSKSEMGKVMKLVMEKVKGKADGKMVSQLVSKLLK